MAEVAGIMEIEAVAIGQDRVRDGVARSRKLSRTVPGAGHAAKVSGRRPAPTAGSPRSTS